MIIERERAKEREGRKVTKDVSNRVSKKKKEEIQSNLRKEGIWKRIGNKINRKEEKISQIQKRE